MKHMYICSSPVAEKFLKREHYHLVLPHLYDTVPGYLDFYKKRSAQGDFILQDNSLFELKECVSGDLIKYADRVGATEVMVPEVLRDAEASIAVKDNFFDCALRGKGKYQFAATLQGKSYAELRRHYVNLSDDPRISTIAIPFNFEFDKDDRDVSRRSGWHRFSIIWRLVKEGVWNTHKAHHLLGLYDPIELAAYHPDNALLSWSTYNSIRSNDSSSVFWHSLYGVSFIQKYGLPYFKIESHVNFKVSFYHPLQSRLFKKNKRILERYLDGTAGDSQALLFECYLTASGERE
jgi:hypothetical protein